tara:strand:- start:312 stop:1214 length:903 start_codon:yes stop_codon:yes gene_type:complete
MRIAVAGSSGLIGTKLVQSLRSKGHTVVRIVRVKADIGKDQVGIFWEPETNYINPDNLENFDSIINLCGEKIASFNPFKAPSQSIRSSRISTNLLISRIISKLNNPPRYFIAASAYGYYKASNIDNNLITEDSAPGNGFLSQLAMEWEEASRFYQTPYTKIINLRLGNVLDKKSIFLKTLSKLSKLKIKSIGDGEQSWPWVSIDDVVGVVEFIINSNYLEGPINVVSPQLTSAEEFMQTISRKINTKGYIKLSSLIIKITTNNLTEKILLNNYPITPTKLTINNYNFKIPSLKEAVNEYL